MTRNPASGLRIRTSFPQPERIEVFSRQEVLLITRCPVQERDRLRRNDLPTEYSYRKALYTLTMQYLMIKLMFSTGIRPWEMVHVEVDDLDVWIVRPLLDDPLDHSRGDDAPAADQHRAAVRSQVLIDVVVVFVRVDDPLPIPGPLPELPEIRQ